MVDQQVANEPAPLGPLDPAWWRPALPPTNPTLKQSAVDIDATDPPRGWEQPELVSRELHVLAQRAPNDSVERDVLSALADASSAMLEPENFAEPFTPFASWRDGSRSVLPSDIDQARIALLVSAAPLLEHLPMRARIADVAWTYGDKSDIGLLGLALDAYLAAPLQLWAWHTVSHNSWKRALDLILRRGKAEATRRDAALDQIRQRIMDGTPADGFMLVDLAVMYRRAGKPDAAPKRLLADKLETLAVQRDAPRLRRHLDRAAAQLWVAVGDPDRAHAATVRVAALYEAEADARLKSEDRSAMAAGLDLENAIRTLTPLPRKYRATHQIDERIADLRRRLRDTREATVDEMVATELDPVDLTSVVRAAEKSVSGHHRVKALARLAGISALTDPDQVLEQARESLQDGVLSRLFARSTFAADGRKVATASGGIGDPDDEELWSHIVRYFSFRSDLIVTGQIIPALDVITIEHRYDMAFMRRICMDSPTVPPGHVDLWARGLWHGLNSDFPSAISILIPQAEQLLRQLLKRHGVYTLTVDRDTGVEAEKGMGALLVMPETRDVLGPALQLEMRALFTEQEGANLRNEAAHGLMTDSAAWSANAVYAWWLLLRIVVLPLWVALTSAGDDDNAAGDE